MKADTSTLSEPDKCVVGAVCKMADEGIIDNSQKSVERQKVEKKEVVVQSVLQNFFLGGWQNSNPDTDRNMFMPGI